MNTLKLDQGFMDRLGRDDKANAIAEAVTRFTHSLSLTVIAEGVETSGSQSRRDAEELDH